jgi:ribose/xylose/arabinose/galactoside ABC-type transport system permease subunit
MNQPRASEAQADRPALSVSARAELLPRLRQGGIVLPFLVLFIVLSVASGPFFTKTNLLDILDQQSATLIIAAAGTLVLVAGGIDLSVGATYALAGVTAATFTVLAGIVVGGTSILGGEGAIWRTVVGVLFIALIGNGSDLLGLNPLYDQIALGGILLIAVGTDAWSRLRTG